jgi:hypothetical protein
MWGDGTATNGDGTAGTVIGGADTFIFATGSGVDMIMDFEDNNDLIDVSGYGFDELSDMIISDDNVDTTIDFGGGNMVTLKGVGDSSVLTADDFIFA